MNLRDLDEVSFRLATGPITTLACLRLEECERIELLGLLTTTLVFKTSYAPLRGALRDAGQPGFEPSRADLELACPPKST